MDLGFDVVVTITGIVLVFAILVLLMAIITLEGKIFDAMNGKKAAAKAAPTVAAKPAAPPQSPLPHRLLLHPRWSRASPPTSWPPSWLPSTRWATASMCSRQCAAAKTAGARLVSTTPPHLFNTGGKI